MTSELMTSPMLFARGAASAEMEALLDLRRGASRKMAAATETVGRVMQVKTARVVGVA
jgi:hypothetical protein